MNNSTAILLIGGRDISFDVGISYVTIGIIFIPLHIICSYLIYTDKEMQNPTYQLMINLSVADIFELCSIALYAGGALITNYQPSLVHRWMAFVLLVCWYVNCVLFVLVAISRWVAITRSHMMAYIFR